MTKTIGYEDQNTLSQSVLMNKKNHVFFKLLLLADASVTRKFLQSTIDEHLIIYKLEIEYILLIVNACLLSINIQLLL